MRLHLQVPPAFRVGLDQLAADTGLSRDELVRRAVALYAFAQQQRQQGRQLGFFTTDTGTIKTLVTL